MSSPIHPDPTASGDTFDGPAASLLRAWRLGQPPELSDFVAGLGPLAPTALAELARIDLEERWQRGDRRRAEAYLAAFPALAADEESALDVIYSEYLARELTGEHPEIAEYQRRFPRYSEVLAEQIWLHRAIETADEELPFEVDDDLEPLDDAAVPDASYEILEEIGRGGMAVVYKARQPALGREVALKMMRSVDASNPELLDRFRSEARVVASLRHRHIVQVYDFGDHDGLPYLTMELVEGGSLAQRLGGAPWSARRAAEAMIVLADAVQYAHEQGVIHRDLKPANVLAAGDAQSLDLKITDFGLAKLFHDDTAHQTKSVAFLGTPSYMAPEQASGRARDVGVGTDVYALGAILYELLTGRPPFRGESSIETLRQLLTSEPVSLERLAPQAPRDLATICNKCLHPDVQRRYASAAELRADLERFLAGVPVRARPISPQERAWRWCRRNPAWAVALSALALLVLSLLAVSLWYSGRLARELTNTRRAEQSERVANRAAQSRLWDAYLSEVAARNGSRQVGQRFAALETVDKAAVLLKQIGATDERTLQLRNAVLSSVALPDIRKVRALGPFPTGGNLCDLSLTGDCYVTATVAGALAGRRLSDNGLLWSIEHEGELVQPFLSSDGRFVAATNEIGSKVWRVDGERPEVIWERTGARYFSFAPDHRFAAVSGPSGGMQLVDLARAEAPARPLGKGAASSYFAFDPAGRRVAVRVGESVQIIATASGEVEFEFPTAEQTSAQLAWHPSGEYVAAWTNALEVELWDVVGKTRKLTLPHRAMPAMLAFTDDGSLLASRGLWDSRLLLWDVNAGQRVLEVKDFGCHAAEAAGDGRIVFLTVETGGAELWELQPGACRSLAQSLHAPLAYWYKASIDPSGRLLAASTEAGAEIWDLQTNRRVVARPGAVCTVEFDQAGSLVVAFQNQDVFRYPRSLDHPAPQGPRDDPPPARVAFGPPAKLTDAIVAQSLAMDPAARTLLSLDGDGWVVSHLDRDAAPIRLQTELDPRKGAVSPDGRVVVIANWDFPGATVWDSSKPVPLTKLAIGKYGVVQFSPDGRLLAASPDGVTLWRTSDWQRVGKVEAEGTIPTGMGICFSPDSRVLVVGQPNGVIRLVDTATSRDCASLVHPDWSMAAIIAISPDQRKLVTSSRDERAPAQVWDLVALRRELAQRDLDWPREVLESLPAPPDEKLEVLWFDEGQGK